MAMPPPYPPARPGEGSIVDFVPDLPPWFYEPKGRYEEHLFESQVLRGNPLGDPHRRPLWVYLPPGDEADPHRPLPEHLRNHGADVPDRHVAKPSLVPPELPGTGPRAA